MTTEEKAKAYDEAIKKAKTIYKCDSLYNVKDALESIFLELKEDEDERIRKALLNEFILLQSKGYKFAGLEGEEIIAWLEKQGVQKSCTELSQTPHKYNVDDWIISKYNGIYQVKEVMRGSYNLLCTSNAEEINSISIVDNTSRLLCMKDIQDLLEKQGEQRPTDKVEPKFKEDDWLINPRTSHIIHIKDVLICGNKGIYELENSSMSIKNVEDNFRLWTIQDAKDGDVLFSPSHNLLWLHKDEETCHVGSNLNYNSGSIVINKPICIPTDVQPATKEQREQLFAEMNEAGYEWDAEKKELTKIEQKPDEWKQENVEELTEFENAMMHIGGSFFGENAGLNPNDTDAVKEQAQYLLELAQNPTWSEEDEVMLDKVIERIHKHSAGDEEYLDIYYWLKSLKDRYTWKPSHEQIRELGIVATGKGWFNTEILSELLEQLKKLKG